MMGGCCYEQTPDPRLLPCPNDTFMFYPLVHGWWTPNISFSERLEDVETLNLLALKGALDITKVSYQPWAISATSMPAPLRAAPWGGAVVRCWWPRVTSISATWPAKPIAVPGRYTTALLLLRLFDPAPRELY